MPSNSGNLRVGEPNWRPCWQPFQRFQSVQLCAGGPPRRCLRLGYRSANFSPFRLWPTL